MTRDRISTGDGVRMEAIGVIDAFDCCLCAAPTIGDCYRVPIGGGWSLYCVPCAEAISLPAGLAVCDECGETDGKCGCLAPVHPIGEECQTCGAPHGNALASDAFTPAQMAKATSICSDCGWPSFEDGGPERDQGSPEDAQRSNGPHAKAARGAWGGR